MARQPSPISDETAILFHAAKKRLYLNDNVTKLEVMRDLNALGLDPEVLTEHIQSHILEHKAKPQGAWIEPALRDLIDFVGDAELAKKFMLVYRIDSRADIISHMLHFFSVAQANAEDPAIAKLLENLGPVKQELENVQADLAKTLEEAFVVTPEDAQAAVEQFCDNLVEALGRKPRTRGHE